MSAAQGVAIGFAVLGAAAGGAAGAAAGAAAAGTMTSFVMMGASIGMTVGGIVGNALFPTKLPGTQGPRLNDKTIQTSTYGAPIPIVYGVMRIAGNVIWSTELAEAAHVEDVSMGGKGGGPKQEQTTYTYSISLAIGLCEGPIIGLRKVWTDGELFYDLSNPAPGINFPIRIYTGSETQTADAAIQADKGAANVPAFRGLAYVVFENLQLGQWGNRVPNFEFEVVASGTLGSVTIKTTNGNFTYFDAIDPVTGLVWYSYDDGANGGAVNVYEPENMTLVQSFAAKSPHRLAYQPSFMYIAAFSQTIQIAPARMWVGGNRPGTLGGVYASIETESGKITEYAFSSGGWPGMVLYCPFTKMQPEIWLGSSNSGSGFIYSVDTENGVATRIDTNMSSGIYTIADWTYGLDCVYALDANNKVYKLGPNAVEMVAPVANGGYSNFVGRLAYNPDENCLYAVLATAVTNAMNVVKYDENLNVLWTRSFSANQWVKDVRYHEGLGYVWIIFADVVSIPAYLNTLLRINLSTGATVETIVTDLASSALYHASPYPYSEFLVGANFGTPGQAVKMPITSAATPSAPSLQTIVSNLSTRAGLAGADLDVTGLSGTVDGYLVGQRSAVRSALEPLQQAYFFDVVESDSKAKYVARGGASVATIPNDDVAAHTRDTASPPPVEQARMQEVDLPNELNVVYVDAAMDYKTNTQYSRRLTGSSEEKVAVEVPMVVSATKAKQIADVLLHDAWMERDRLTLTVSRKYLKLDPADPITYTDASGDNIALRITQIQYGLPGMMKLFCVKEDASIYSFSNTGVEGDPLDETVASAAPTQLLLLDIPMLQDADDNLGAYVAVGPYY